MKHPEVELHEQGLSTETVAPGVIHVAVLLTFQDLSLFARGPQTISKPAI